MLQCTIWKGITDHCNLSYFLISLWDKIQAQPSATVSFCSKKIEKEANY